MTDTSCREILHSLSKFIVKNNITKPLNDGTICYYSVNNDRTVYHKKLFFSSRDT